MNENTEVLEQAVAELRSGITLEAVVQAHYGEEIAKQMPELQASLRNIRENAEAMRQKYMKVDLAAAIFSVIDEKCGGDVAQEWVMVSNLKYNLSLWNLALSREELEEQGEDSLFLEETLDTAHEKELAMAETATPEELGALRTELEAVIPADEEALRKSLSQQEGEDWTDVLAAREELARVDAKFAEDVSTLTACEILRCHPEMTPVQAAADTARADAATAGSRVFTFMDLAGSVTTAGVVLVAVGSKVRRLERLAKLGFALITGSVYTAGAVLAGYLGTQLLKKITPTVAKAWSALRPVLRKVLESAKASVAFVIGVVVNGVFRPAIRWVKDTFVPRIEERILHPLQRRLRLMLDWLSEKKSQVLDFFRRAINPRAYAGTAPAEEEAVDNLYIAEPEPDITEPESILFAKEPGAAWEAM